MRELQLTLPGPRLSRWMRLMRSWGGNLEAAAGAESHGLRESLASRRPQARAQASPRCPPSTGCKDKSQKSPCKLSSCRTAPVWV